MCDDYCVANYRSLLYIKYESQESIVIKVRIFLFEGDEERRHVKYQWKKMEMRYIYIMIYI